MSAATARRAAAAALCGVLSMAAVHGQETAPAKTLEPGEGAALTMARCALCHDITHVTRSRLTRDEWDDNIKVMIARGAPIAPQEIPVILDYLSAHYGRDRQPK